MLTGDGSFRDRWVAEVWRTALITDTTRVQLLALLPEMDENGRVSVPRDYLAELLGKTPRTINERFKHAIDAGFLRRVSRGQRHQSAVYQGLLSGKSGVPADGRLSEKGLPPTETPPPILSGKVSSTLTPDLSGKTVLPTEQSDSEKPRVPAETRPPYKDHACAHSKRSPQPQTTHQTVSDQTTGATVVQLFDDKKLTTEKTHSARKRAAVAHEDDDAFDAFWKIYPRRVAKGAARKAWAKAIKNGANPELIILGARRYATDPRRVADDPKYTAHPATWLNQERWTDEDDPAPTTAPAAALDRRQQATNDIFDRAMARARARDAQEGHR